MDSPTVSAKGPSGDIDGQLPQQLVLKGSKAWAHVTQFISWLFITLANPKMQIRLFNSFPAGQKRYLATKPPCLGFHGVKLSRIHPAKCHSRQLLEVKATFPIGGHHLPERNKPGLGQNAIKFPLIL